MFQTQHQSTVNLNHAKAGLFLAAAVAAAAVIGQLAGSVQLPVPADAGAIVSSGTGDWQAAAEQRRAGSAPVSVTLPSVVAPEITWSRGVDTHKRAGASSVTGTQPSGQADIVGSGSGGRNGLIPQ